MLRSYTYIYAVLGLIGLVIVSSCTYFYIFGIILKASSLPEYFFRGFSEQEDLIINYQDTTFNFSFHGSNLNVNADTLDISLPKLSTDLKVKEAQYSVKITDILSGSFRFKFKGLNSLKINNPSVLTEFGLMTLRNNVIENDQIIASVRKLDLLVRQLGNEINFSIPEVRLGELLFKDLTVRHETNKTNKNNQGVIGKFIFNQLNYKYTAFLENKLFEERLQYHLKFSLSLENESDKSANAFLDDNMNFINIKNFSIESTFNSSKDINLNGQLELFTNNKAFIKSVYSVIEPDKLSDTFNLMLKFDFDSNESGFTISDISIADTYDNFLLDGKIVFQNHGKKQKVGFYIDRIYSGTDKNFLENFFLNEIPSLQFNISVTENNQSFELTQLFVSNEFVTIPLQGSIKIPLPLSDMNGEIELSIKRVTSNKLSLLLPQLFNSLKNEVFGRNIDLDGYLSGGTHIVVNGGLLKKFETDLEFSDVEVSYFGKSLVKGISGLITFLENKLHISFKQIITSERFYPAEGRSEKDLNKLKEYATLLTDSSIVVENGGNKQKMVSFQGNLSGHLDPLIRFVDMVPHFKTHYGKILENLTDISGDLKIYGSGKLLQNSMYNMDNFNIKGKIHYASVVDFFPDERILLSDIDFEYNDSFFVVDSLATILDSVFKVKFIQTDQSAQATVLNLEGKVGENSFEKYFQAASNIKINGNIPLNASVIFQEDKIKFQLMSDLMDSHLTIDDLKYEKLRGERGSLAIEGRRVGKDNLEFNLDFITPDIVLRSKWINDEKVMEIDVKEFKVSNVIDTSGNIRRSLNDYEVHLVGDYLNYQSLKKILKENFSGSEIKFLLDIEKLELTEKYFLKKSIGQVKFFSGFGGTLTGSLNGLEKVTIAFEKLKDSRARFTATSKNAGNIFRALKAYQNGYGGDFYFDGVLKENGGVVGKLKTNDIQVRNAPILAQLVSLSSLNGMIDLLAGKGIVFQNVEGEVDSDGARTILKNGFAEGQSIGITLDGIFTRTSQAQNQIKMNASGVLSPFFNINNAVSKFPLFGNIFGSKSGEGAIGFSFKLQGTKKEPLVLVNPFSILAPGRLRDVLGQ